ncbi:unnamed protein product [Cyprideis torosa]|uniref:Uncharacterized protein n=1 Tax=Cyprideis torosa TaxID=163714 RepID=A0A7R8WW43_9CRUS|nr:unnamed protein product [Cyprideis torosa]CAG0908011.1 unnamed protein product [Cyprideis torosa]
MEEIRSAHKRTFRPKSGSQFCLRVPINAGHEMISCKIPLEMEGAASASIAVFYNFVFLKIMKPFVLELKGHLIKAREKEAQPKEEPKIPKEKPSCSGVIPEEEPSCSGVLPKEEPSCSVTLPKKEPSCSGVISCPQPSQARTDQTSRVIRMPEGITEKPISQEQNAVIPTSQRSINVIPIPKKQITVNSVIVKPTAEETMAAKPAIVRTISEIPIVEKPMPRRIVRRLPSTSRWFVVWR